MPLSPSETVGAVLPGLAQGREQYRTSLDHLVGRNYAGISDYFSPKGEQKGLLLDTNFVADAINLPLIEAKEQVGHGGWLTWVAEHLDFTVWTEDDMCTWRRDA